MLLTPLKLHMVRSTANYSQLALHTQLYKASSEAAQVSIVSLYAPSSLLTTLPPLKELLKDIYDATEYLYDAVPKEHLKEQVINYHKYRSKSSVRKNYYLESSPWISSTASPRNEAVPGTQYLRHSLYTYGALLLLS